MSREILSPEGLRADGRRAREVRKVECKVGFLLDVDGSALFTQGNTSVLATVYGPRESKQRSAGGTDEAVIVVEYSVAPFAGNERKVIGKGDRRSKESAAVIRRSFESIILRHLLPRSEISISVRVLSSDGGALCAAINATSLALVSAGIPMRELLVSASSGLVDDICILDLNDVEKSRNIPLVKVAIFPQSEKIAMMQLDAKLPLQRTEEVCQLAISGCQQIAQIMRQALHSHMTLTLQAQKS